MEQIIKPTLSLMMSYGASKEKNVLDVVFESDYIKLVKQITSRRIIDDAVWTPYRMGKLKDLLGKIASLDDAIFTVKQVLPNVVLVQWINDPHDGSNAYTLYRLTY